MKADEVIRGFDCLLSGRRTDGLAVARRIVAIERHAGRTAVALRLERILDRQLASVMLRNPPSSLRAVATGRVLDELILAEDARETLAAVVREWQSRDHLLAHNVDPRSVVLLSGPSGNGKTAIATGLASAVGLPLYVAHYGTLIESHLGATSKELERIFDFASEVPCVVFFDEADSLATTRSAGTESATREMNRVVNQLLLGLDSLNHRSLVVFATNMPEVIDQALRRRVEVTLDIASPSPTLVEAMIDMLRGRRPILRDDDRWLPLARAARSFAEIESLALDYVRAALLKEAP